MIVLKIETITKTIIMKVLASELRIGNLLVEPSTGYTVNISSIGINHIATNKAVMLSIPLKEEWLLKLGFEKIREFYSLTGPIGTCTIYPIIQLFVRLTG